MMIIVEAWAKWTEDTQIQSVRLVVEIVTRNQSAVQNLIHSLSRIYKQ